ncbi:MAG: hypothetical protein JWR65_2595 [Massilia sp.]|jgi:hypothetical protein|nr:hypothetical protein [Massilia sp.]
MTPGTPKPRKNTRLAGEPARPCQQKCIEQLDREAAASPQETLDAFHEALTAGDKAMATSLLATEVSIYESGYVERSRAEYASHHLAGDIGFAKTSTRKVLKQTERVHGPVPVIWQETETTGTARGKAVHFLGTETAMLEKKDDIGPPTVRKSA